MNPLAIDAIIEIIKQDVTKDMMFILWHNLSVIKDQKKKRKKKSPKSIHIIATILMHFLSKPIHLGLNLHDDTGQYS